MLLKENTPWATSCCAAMYFDPKKCNTPNIYKPVGLFTTTITTTWQSAALKPASQAVTQIFDRNVEI